ncbi:YSIRK-type signal peptide-containing protein, partial [Limosilactobacillus sp.]|uniref:YSIRK-type signal peptide-containing protein n=1 Tax=Limosilactobacillus sp. TaxID=2773925 RepID=UPI00359FBAE8
MEFIKYKFYKFMRAIKELIFTNQPPNNEYGLELGGKFMVSKNNTYLKEVMHSHRVPHYGLRKLGIGVTSVLLGTTLYFGANAPVHADVTTA